MRSTHLIRATILPLVALTLAAATARAEDPVAPAKAHDSTTSASYSAVLDKAVGYLTKNQAADGSFSASASPAVTALIVSGLIRNGREPSDPLLAKALKYLEGFVQADGGIYVKGGKYKNYETCIIMVCLSDANRDGRYKKILDHADKFLKGEQWSEANGIEKSDVRFGGAGYAPGNSRTDLSNTSSMIEALHAAGTGPDDEAMKRALVFVSRCQNLEGPNNTTEFANKVNDGGSYYSPAAGGSSPAGKTDNGGLRSYGSMTYAGLKSMVYAGLTADDPRVKAAVSYITKNYTMTENPAMGEAGHYYYLQTLAKALSAAKLDTITTPGPDGKKHVWRHDLLEELAKLQKPDGSWVNTNQRWLEANADLDIGYALIALSYTKPSK